MSIPVRTIYIQLRASGEKLKADMTAANAQLVTVGRSGKEAGRQISDGANQAHQSLVKVAEHGAEAALAMDNLYRITVKYTAVAVASASTTENLVNGYRALRIALSPTPFTVATVATGILVEQTLKLTNARAKLIEQQSLIAATTRLPISTVERIDAASGISGANPGKVRSLFSTLQSRDQSNPSEVRAGLNSLNITGPVNTDALAKIASAFSSIEDPVKRADAAVLLFGSDAGMALQQLNSAFAGADGAVKKYGLVLDELSRRQIYQLRQEFLSFKAPVTLVKTEFDGLWESFKRGVVISVAAFDDMNRRGAQSLDELIRKVPGLQALAGAMQDLKSLSPAELAQGRRGGPGGSADQGLTADDLFAQAQVARARHTNETLEGLRQAQAKEQTKADALYQQIEDDQKKRRDNPSDPGLLSPEARFSVTTQHQSASQRSTLLGDKVASTEAAQKIRDEDALTAAIGRGYQARRAADIEAKVANELAEKGGNAETIRARLSAQYDATHRHEIAEVINELQKQIELERTQAAVQQFGSEAVRAATLKLKLGKELLNNESTRQIQLEHELDAASKDNRDAAAIAGLQERTRATERLTAAIADGAGAVHAAELANKTEEMDRGGHAAEIPATKTLDATERKKADAEELASLRQKTIETDRLTVATKEGAAAVARVTLENKLAEIARGTGTDKGALQNAAVENDAAEKRLKGTQDLKAAEKAAAEATAETNRKLDQELAAVKRLAAAVGQGPEAVRRAELENKFAAEAAASNDTPIPGVKGVTAEDLKRRSIENIANNSRVTSEALRAGGAPQETLRDIQEQLVRLGQVKVTHQNILDIELSRQKLRQQYLETLSREHRELGTLRDGWAAFWLDMQQQAEKPGKILYDGMHSAVQKLSHELAELVTGGKTSFGKTLQDIGRQITQSAIQGAIQDALGRLAKRNANNQAQAAQAGGTQTTGGGILGRIANALGRLAGGNNKPATPATSGTPGTGDGSVIQLPGGIRIPGLNKDAGGFERGPNAPIANQTPAQLSGVFDELKKAVGSFRLPDGLINRTGSDIDGIPSLPKPVNFNKSRFPNNGLVNRTGSSIDGVPSLPQSDESNPLGTGAVGNASKEIKQSIDKLGQTATETLGANRDMLGFDRNRAENPTGKKSDPVYVFVVNQGDNKGSGGSNPLAGLSGGGGGIAGIFGGLLGSLGGGGGAGPTFASDSSVIFDDVASSAAFLAGGGDIMPGRPTVVGENGPELLMSKAWGSVIPNHQASSWLDDLGTLGVGALNAFARGKSGKGKSPWWGVLSGALEPLLSDKTSGGILGGLFGKKQASPLGGLLGGLFNRGGSTGGGGGAYGPGFGGFFATGGDVQGGRAIVVGEKGPELLVPKSRGTVIPADKTRAMLAGLSGSRKPMVPFGGAREMGGAVSPSAAYLVGERGPELMMMTANSATSRSVSERTKGGGGGNHTYHVAVQGSGDREIYENTRRAITASHKAAVGTAVQANVERARRVPQANR